MLWKFILMNVKFGYTYGILYVVHGINVIFAVYSPSSGIVSNI